MRVHQAYRFALDPSPRQEQMLASHAGAARFAWNWALSACRDRYTAEGRWYSAAELHRLWNAEKKADPRLAWWGENSKCVYQESFRDLDRALRDYMKSRKGERKGRKRRGWPVLSEFEDMLGLRRGESQAGPFRAGLPLRVVRLGA